VSVVASEEAVTSPYCVELALIPISRSQALSISTIMVAVVGRGQATLAQLLIVCAIADGAHMGGNTCAKMPYRPTTPAVVKNILIGGSGDYGAQFDACSLIEEYVGQIGASMGVDLALQDFAGELDIRKNTCESPNSSKIKSLALSRRVQADSLRASTGHGFEP
jgi:hypothetical protein